MDEWSAVAQVRHWLWTLQRELDQFDAIHLRGFRMVRDSRGRYTEEAMRAFSEKSATAHWIAVSAHHLVKTLKSPHLPESLRAAQFPPALAEQVEVLRHVKEHEEEHRSEEWQRGRQGARTRTRHERLADAPLFSSRWSPEEGAKLDGILSLNDLREAASRVEAALPPPR